MCLVKEGSVNHLFVHCQWVSSLWFLILSLVGISWAQPSNVKRCVGSMEKEIEKVLGSWDLKVGSFGYMVVYLEREEPTDF